MAFNRQLHLDAVLPEGIAVMNPFSGEGGAAALDWAGQFYNQFYNDTGKRRMLFGINPGRNGGGITGVPFTDFKRMEELGIGTNGQRSHEPSSEFIYAMINALGGANAFYRQFYINSVCPLGFIRQQGAGWVNYNYYDDKQLQEAVTPFIVQSIQQQMAFGAETDEIFSLGKKNAEFLSKLNATHHFAGTVTELPHPRYVMQYKRRFLAEYIEEYRVKFMGA